MSYSTLSVKNGKKWALSVRYSNGSISFELTSLSERRQVYPRDNLALSQEEWNRLVKWVALQHAEDAIAKVPARMTGDIKLKWS